MKSIFGYYSPFFSEHLAYQHSTPYCLTTPTKCRLRPCVSASCMIYVQSTVEENLKWGFALYSSPGSFDPESDDPVSMSDFKNLVNTMAR